MHRIKLSVSLLALLVTATAVAQASSTAPRRFTLPEHDGDLAGHEGPAAAIP